MKVQMRYGGDDLWNAWSTEVTAVIEERPFDDGVFLMLVDFDQASEVANAWLSASPSRRAWTVAGDVEESGNDIVLASWSPDAGLAIELWSTANENEDRWALEDFPYVHDALEIVQAPVDPAMETASVDG